MKHLIYSAASLFMHRQDQETFKWFPNATSGACSVLLKPTSLSSAGPSDLAVFLSLIWTATVCPMNGSQRFHFSTEQKELSCRVSSVLLGDVRSQQADVSYPHQTPGGAKACLHELVPHSSDRRTKHTLNEFLWWFESLKNFFRIIIHTRFALSASGVLPPGGGRWRWETVLVPQTKLQYHDTRACVSEDSLHKWPSDKLLLHNWWRFTTV